MGYEKSPPIEVVKWEVVACVLFGNGDREMVAKDVDLKSGDVGA